MTVTLYEGNNELNVNLTPTMPAVPVANLYGMVTDADTGLYLGLVEVTIADRMVYTDSNGYYLFPDGTIAPGSYTITFAKLGYETLTL